MPLHHPPGHAQVDFGEAVVEVGGRREKVAFFCLILPGLDYPRDQGRRQLRRIFEKYIGESTAIGLTRGLNQLWTKGGILYAPPFR